MRTTRLCTALIALCWTVLAAAQPAHRVWTDVGTRKIMRDAAAPEGAPPSVDLDALRNEYEAFQVVVTAVGGRVSAATVAVSDLSGEEGATIPAASVELRLQHYIEVTQPEKWRGWYPDALLPMPESFEVAEGQSQAVWANLHVPSDTPAGRYSGAVTVTVDGRGTQIPVSLRVRDFSLTPESHFQSAFAIWGGMLAGHYGLSTESAEYRALYERTYRFLTGYRMPPDDLPVPIDSPEAARFLDDPLVNSFRIPYDPNQPEAFQRRISHLREKGWLDKGYVYTIDEPGPEAIPGCYDYGMRIKELAPDARWLLTHGVNDDLLGAVSIWCPVLSGYHKEACQARQALGEHVWWYTCCGPQHPYPTYLINDVATSPRVLSWLQAAWKVEGVLYWSVNIWEKYDGKKYVDRDVWVDPLAFPGANGDGYLIYPGQTHEDPPIPSLRLEWIRQGNEDFETFWLLEEQLKAEAAMLGVSAEQFDPHSAVEALVTRVAPSFTRWNRDPLVMEAARREALDQLEATSVGPHGILWTSAPGGPITAGEDVEGIIWAEPGAGISALVQGEDQEKAISVELDEEPATSPRHVARRFSLSPQDYVTRLTVHIEKDGRTRDFSRTFTLPRPLPPLAGDVLCPWTSPDDLSKWTLANVDAEVTHCEQLGACARLTYRPNVEFPNARLMHPAGFADPDWSQKGYLVLSFFNPGTDTVDLTLKLFTRDGKAQDGLSIQLPPGEPIRYVWSIRDDFTIDTRDIAGFELWMWDRPTPRTIYVGPVLTTQQRPELQGSRALLLTR